jgi:hypothetical protein
MVRTQKSTLANCVKKCRGEMKMDNKLLILGLLAFAFFMGSGYSDPGDADTETTGNPYTYCNGQGFQDTDSDGICDNYASGDCGSGNCQGTGFVDSEGDGICDNRQASGCGGGGCGRGERRGPR